jgi:type IV pilus assembly protein PilV
MGKPDARTTRGNFQHGFTLIEILVAMVVLSLGLLGLAGLQAVSLSNNQTAYYRSIATQQAYDMADRMRANLAGVSVGNYDNLSATAPTDPGCFATNCSIANMAVTDHFQWLSNASAVLPAGSGTVSCIQGPQGSACVLEAPSSSRIFNITVTWSEKTLAGNEARSFVTEFTP